MTENLNATLGSVRPLRTDPATIRWVLEDLEAGAQIGKVAEKYQVSKSQIYKWRNRRAASGYDWPNGEDIAAWHRLAVERAQLRAHKRNLAATYRKRRYLNRGPLMVPAIGVIRRLRALQALGWTQVQLAEHTSVSAARIGHLSQGFRTGRRHGGKAVTTHVRQETHEAVDELFRKLCMTLPPDPDGWVAQRQRDLARRKGWAPPLAWDDIDDPDEHRRADRHDGVRRPPRRHADVDMAIVFRVLNGENLWTTRAEKDEIMRRWVQAGKSARELCGRLGWKESRYGRGAS